MRFNMIGTIYTILIVIITAAIIGLYFLKFVLRPKRRRRAKFVIDGMFVFGAFGLLFIYCFGNGPGLPVSVMLFAVAATQSIILIKRDISRRKVPKWMRIV